MLHRLRSHSRLIAARTAHLIDGVGARSASAQSATRALSLILLAALIANVLATHLLFVESAGPRVFLDELLYKENAAFLALGSGQYNPHYPPLYSLAIAPSFLFGNWYGAMISLNSVFIASYILVAFLICLRFMGVTLSLFAAFLCSLLPHNVVYPSYIMSENLFLPVFMIAMAIVMHANFKLAQAFLFGIILAALFLTRYLALPALPLLFLGWMLAPLSSGGPRSPRLQLARATTALGGVAVMCGAWAAYCLAVGIPLLPAFGLRKIPNYVSLLQSWQAGAEINSPAPLAFWLLMYLCYAALTAGPFLLPLAVHGIALKWRDIRSRQFGPEQLFLILTGALTVVYVLLAARHSEIAPYNRDAPSRIQGRYLLQLAPLYVIAGVIALENLRRAMKPKPIHISLLCFAALLFAWLVLYRGAIWQLPPWFARITFLVPDAAVYDHNFVAATAACCFALLALILRRGGRAYVWAFPVLLIWQGVVFSATVTKASGEPPETGHARHLAQALATGALPRDAIVELDVPGADVRTIYRGVRFWDPDVKESQIVALASDEPETATGTATFRLTQQPTLEHAVYEYRVGGQAYRIVRSEGDAPRR